LILSFGKYKNADLEDVPSNYLKWLINNHDDDWVVEAAEAEFKYRSDHGSHFYSDD